MNPNFSLFITMNRDMQEELPDNLKVLFRPVAMIVEIMLYSFGFTKAIDLEKNG
jgi:hypothetical protein